MITKTNIYIWYKLINRESNGWEKLKYSCLRYR